MKQLEDQIISFSEFKNSDDEPWVVIKNLDFIIREKIQNLNDSFIVDNWIAIHKTAIIENNVTLKGPIIINANCFIGANSYLRNGVYLSDNVKIGTGVEIKSSVVFDSSAIAHFNFIGDSIIGSNVNFEAGSITANHYNERKEKTIFIKFNEVILDTKSKKFGAFVGDYCKIGANAVLSPGTILEKGSVVKRLELIEQIIK